MLSLFQNVQWLLAAGDSAKGGDHGGDAHAALAIEGLWFYIALVVLISFGLMFMAKKEFGQRFFRTRISQYAEQLYIFVENLVVGIIGSHGRKYMPMIMTFWIVIFISNCVALFFPTSPTADLSFNLGMALIAVGYVQYEGMRANGVLGHFSHFAGPKMGLALIPINGMIFIIEIISETMKNVSLSLRLYGNIDGGHRAAVAMNELGEAAYIPVGAFLLPVKLLTCVVQALIFCLLFCVYISLVTHHDHEHESHPHADDREHAHDSVPATA